ncbi:hypothetical protein CPB86DRAFT_830528, partial [Serendipita vermifera]
MSVLLLQGGISVFSTRKPMLVPLLLGTTVELTSREDCFLTDVAHLILEITQSGEFVGKVNLWSQGSNQGVWDADQTLGLRDVIAGFMVSNFMQIDENDRHLLGFIELTGPALFDAVGGQYEISLVRQEDWPDLILRTKVHAIEDIQAFMAGHNQHAEEDRVQQALSEGVAAYKVFDRHGNLQSLDEAISKFEAATEMTPRNDTRIPYILGRLGIYLVGRFERLGRVEDINDGVEQLEAAIGLTSDDDLDEPMYLDRLGNSLEKRFERLGRLADIDSAITALQAATHLIPDGHPRRPGCLNSLGTSLQKRFNRLGHLADLANSITTLQAAVNLAQDHHPDRLMYLNSLAVSLQKQFERAGNLVDIDSAI